MKEAVKPNSLEGFEPKEIIMGIISHIICALMGFGASRTVVLGALTPFGISFLAGSPIHFMPSVATGVFFGYLFPVTQQGGFRYIASLFAILAIKLLLGSFKKIVNNPFFLGLITLLAVFFTSAVTFDGIPTNILNRIAEAFLAAVGAYFVCRGFAAADKSSPGLTNEELACVFISLSILICGFSPLRPAGISLGNIMGVILILIAARYGGVLSGSVSGIALAFMLILTGEGSAIIIALSFGGMMAGVFSSYTKYAQIGAVMISCLVSGVINSDITGIPVIVTEAAIGSVVFLMLPKSIGRKIGGVFTAFPKVTVPTGLKKSLIMRLCVASNALKDVSSTVDRVSLELSKINSPDFSEVISGVEYDSCAGCKLRIYCWETKKNETLGAMLEMTKAVKRGVFSPDDFAPEEFKERCLKPKEISAAVYKRYSEYASRMAAESRIDEVRSVISDQFNGISAMLSDLAKDFEKDEQFDNSAALSAAAALKNIDISAEECSSRFDKFGRMTIELKVKKTPELVLNKLQMMKLVSNVVERDFDVPSVNESGGDYFITFTEHAQFCVDIGANQIAAGGSRMCGDAYTYFYDSKGHFVMVLSDGMGTGGRAAVDGAMASGLMSRLLKAGFGYDCSLKILNSSMLFKSTDESLATVDVACLDLYTGKLELLKAGAAPTLVMRSGRTGKAESSSLPAGILRNIGFDKATLKMSEGDIIILLSDGAVSEGTDWIRTELENWEGGKAQELAEKISEGAKRRRTDSHEDDITVLAAVIEKAV